MSLGLFIRPALSAPSVRDGMVTSSRNLRLLNGCIRTPSESSPANFVIMGPSAASHTGGGSHGIESGTKIGVIRLNL